MDKASACSSLRIIAATSLVLGRDVAHVVQELVVGAGESVTQRMEELLLAAGEFVHLNAHLLDLLQQCGHSEPPCVFSYSPNHELPKS